MKYVTERSLANVRAIMRTNRAKRREAANKAADRQDAMVMRARVQAKGRGASPVEVQTNVLRFDHDSYPVPVSP